ncbi:MAG: TolC family protein [Archangiaceae bacterium]|nr:TolC family protein [Archangiaceae bacterium]
MKTAFAVVALLAGSAQAGSLKQLLDAADQQNVDRRISAEQRRRAAAEAVQAWTSLLPSLTAQAVWTHNQYFATFDRPKTNAAGMTLDVNGNPVTSPGQQIAYDTLVIQPAQQYDAIFKIDVPLIDVARWYRTGAASAAEAAAVDREEATRDLVRRQVVGSYYAYAAALAVRDSAKRSVGVAQAQAQLQEVRANAGAATELERLRATAEVQRNRQVVSDTESLVATSRRSLQTLTGQDPGDAATLPDDDLRPEPPFQELEKNVDSLPQIRAAEQDIVATSRSTDANRLQIVPTISGQFTERISTLTGFTGQPASWNGGLALTWRLDGPTLAGFRVQSAVEATASLAAERARLVARDQIHSDWQRLNAALQKVEAAKAQLQAAERAAQVARDRYAAGAATQIDVIQAERDLFGAEVGQIQARTELASARLSLRISAGQPLQVE